MLNYEFSRIIYSFLCMQCIVQKFTHYAQTILSIYAYKLFDLIQAWTGMSSIILATK